MTEVLQEAIQLACSSLKEDEVGESIVLAWNVDQILLDASAFEFPKNVLKRVRVMTCSSPSDVIELMHIINGRKIDRVFLVPGGSKLALALFEEFCQIISVPLTLV